MEDNGIFNGSFEILKTTLYIENAYRDTTSFSQGNFLRSQNPDQFSTYKNTTVFSPLFHDLLKDLNCHYKCVLLFTAAECFRHEIHYLLNHWSLKTLHQLSELVSLCSKMLLFKTSPH